MVGVRVKSVFLAVLLTGGLAACGLAVASTDMVARMFAEQIEQGRWQSGGLKSETMLKAFRRAIATGDIEVVAAVESEVLSEARRGQVDLEPYLELLTEIDKLPRRGTRYENLNEVSSALRRRAVFYQLSRSDRQEIYRQTLQSQRTRPSSSRDFVVQGEAFSENWYTAASAGLQEQMDDLVPLIDQGHAIEKRPPDAAAQLLERHVNEVLLPLARARLSGEWVSQYLSFTRRSLAGDGNGDMRSLLVREAMLELVAKNQRNVVGQLKKILLTHTDAKRGRSDRPSPEDDVAARAVVGAVRSLGDPGFEERTWRKWHPATLEELDRSLKNILATSGSPSTN